MKDFILKLNEKHRYNRVKPFARIQYTTYKKMRNI